MSTHTDVATPANDARHRAELLERGFTCVPRILSPDLLARLRSATDRLLDAQSAEARNYNRTQGSMIGVQVDPIFGELYLLPAALGSLARMGWTRPSITTGYVISKPPGGPRLFWHYDWFSWQDPFSFNTTLPPQLAFMYYLSDTARQNGCLRAIPGSHITHNPLHDLLLEPHSAALSRGESMANPAFSDRPDELDVPARAGDLLIVDARLLHSAHANNSDHRRTVITLWYQPDPDAMPERIKAYLAKLCIKPADHWPEPDRQRYESMQMSARYQGSAEPYTRELYRRRSPGAG